jgi:deoxyribodipyrimidine photolyase-related protein
MSNLHIIFHDQLSENISALKDIKKSDDIIMMYESYVYFSSINHHKKKIIFLISAMRHFYQKLKNQGFKIIYKKIEDNIDNNIENEIKVIIKKYNIQKLILTKPSEYKIFEQVKSWYEFLKIDFEIIEDNRFLCDIQEFKDWADERKEIRLEYFYRMMRRKYTILIEDDKPIGGKWNFDSDNRKVPESGINIPQVMEIEIDIITKKVITLVKKYFSNHFGDSDNFHFAVTRDSALEVLDYFVKYNLNNFGKFQDAMLQGEPWMFHSHISFYLNTGLLLPGECIRAVENSYYKNNNPLNSVEGFIRQILGWREFVRGIYWLKMPEYYESNYLNASRNLPEFYWSGNTDMNCIYQCIDDTKRNAYAHHIQRLMVLGNYALLLGVAPKQLNNWFLVVFADAYEWVELPNVSGMVLYADGGLLASKPYASGGAYINKMSNYCKSCKYSETQKSGEKACPFNYLYWNFLIKNRSKLKSNNRLRMMYSMLDKMDHSKIALILENSELHINNINQ